MRASLLTILALATLLVAGCSSGRKTNQELVERELRMQEDQIWWLRDQLDNAQCQLDSMQRENDSLRKETATGDTGAMPDRGTGPLTPPAVEMSPGSPRSPAAPPSRRPTQLRRPADQGPPPEMSSPLIEPGIEMPSDDSPPPDSSDAPEMTLPSAASHDRGQSQRARNVSHNEPADDGPVAETATAAPPADPHRAAKIVLNKRLTGGRNSDNRAGDEALSVVFEPRNSADQLIRAPGEVSIVVLDPAESGAAARVARWDFNTNDALSHFHTNGAAHGYRFELPWSGKPPTHDQLELFVRLKTPDGQRLIAAQTIRIVVPLLQPRQADQFAGPHGQAGNQFGNQVAGRPGNRPPYMTNGNPNGMAYGNGMPDGNNMTIDPYAGDGAYGNYNVNNMANSGQQPNSPPSTNWFTKSRIMGGPGYFDGSMLRSISGGRLGGPAPNPNAVAGQNMMPGAPYPYQQMPGGQFPNPSMPGGPYQGEIVYEGGNQPTLASQNGGGPDLGGNSQPMNIVEPGEQIVSEEIRSTQESSAAEEEPAKNASRSGRPTWKPYR